MTDLLLPDRRLGPSRLDADSDDPDARFARIVAELTRRGFLTGSFGAAALLGLAACGAPGQPSSPGSAATTRVVTTAKGPVTVPTNPQRVVCVDTQSLADLFDVGFHPVGALDGLANNLLDADQAAYASITKIGSSPFEVDIEQVAALAPDLIIGLDYGVDDPVYPKLAALAPIAYFSFATTGDWQTIATAVPDAVNLVAKVDQLKTAYTQKATRLTRAYASILATTRWAVVNGYDDANFSLWLPDSDAGQVLTAIGAQFASVAAGRTGDSVGLSMEQVDQLADADVILVGADATGTMYPATQTLTGQETWRQLPASRNNRVYPLSRLFPYSYGQAGALLDQLAGVLDALPAS